MNGTNTSPDLSRLRVLVVDDEADIRLGLRRLLGAAGIEAAEAASGLEAIELLKANPADLVLTDLMMPGMTGAELLDSIKRERPETVVVLLTGFGTVQAAVQCMQNGAAHFLTKPFDNEEIVGLVRRLGCQILSRCQASHLTDELRIVAEDPATAKVFELVARVAPSSAPVLIEGESGTGKELVARAVHRRSSVADQPFQAVNCAALSETLLESELFGHVKGAFTGADRDRRGLFAEAHGGTVFLDEVSSMSPAFQGKLLRVLQEKLVRPVGGSRDVAVDFRLVAATNRDLEALVGSGGFREDLYYRLQVVRIHIPPLRERPADIVPLALQFMAREAEACGGPPGAPPEISDEALLALREHDWPGNVRELENVMQRALIVCCGGRILPFHLGIGESGWSGADSGADELSGDYSEAKRVTIERFQRDFVQRALEKSAGNVSRAAEACGMTRVALQKILRQLSIDRTLFEPD